MSTDGVISVVLANTASWEDLQAVLGTRGEASMPVPAIQDAARGVVGVRWGQGAGVPAPHADRLGHAGSGTTSGLVAYLDGEPVGWCGVEPRTAYPRLLLKTRVPWKDRTEDQTDGSVWAVTCFATRTGSEQVATLRSNPIHPPTLPLLGRTITMTSAWLTSRLRDAPGGMVALDADPARRDAPRVDTMARPSPDRDQADAQRAARRDDLAYQRDDAAEERDAHAQVRDEAAGHRDDGSVERRLDGAQRDRAAAGRDRAAAARDRAAAERDQSAVARDVAAEHSGSDRGLAGEQVLVDREVAAAERVLAAEDRAAAAEDRAHAAEDRAAAAEDRAQATAEREQAARDRAAAVKDRAAAATDRAAAARDRAETTAEREQAAIEREQRSPDEGW